MSLPAQRSKVDNLHKGMSDGSYKEYAPNRGGFVEDSTVAVRRSMSGAWHGFNEIKTKPLPDGTSWTCKMFDSITPEDNENL